MEQQMLIKYIVVDGEEIYDDFAEQLIDRLNRVKDIQIVEQTKDEAVQAICVSALDYANRAAPQIELLFKDIYRGATNESWDKLSELFNGIQWLYDTCTALASDWVNLPQSEAFVTYTQAIDQLMPNISLAVENKDEVSIADLIQYEFLPVFNELHDNLQQINDSEVVRNDVN
jgi:hypothetical protein